LATRAVGFASHHPTKFSDTLDYSTSRGAHQERRQLYPQISSKLKKHPQIAQIQTAKNLRNLRIKLQFNSVESVQSVAQLSATKRAEPVSQLGYLGFLLSVCGRALAVQ
jgi:hypothetical protein